MIVLSRIAACLILLALPAAAAPVADLGGTPVALASLPGTPLDKTARALVAQDLAEARQSREIPLVLVGTARLGNATDRPALFVQLQSPRECGSAGCDTAVYAWIKGRWVRVLDAVSGPVVVLRARHHGMADLVANTERYAWTGTTYANTRPAPAVDLRPRTPRR